MVDHPGVIPGYGAVPAAVARAMAADRDLVRWIIDPGTGELIDVGSETYRPSARMRGSWPLGTAVCGSRLPRRAEGCEFDHVRNFSRPGGRPSPQPRPAVPAAPQRQDPRPLAARPRPAHHSKTWTSPLGRTYTKGTDPLLA